MGQFNSYGGVFLAFLMVAIGGAFFKPIIVATVSKTTTKDNDTLGFGIFYMIVNIGGFIGPFVASKLRDISWTYVFIMSAAVIILNLLLMQFYKEPGREKNAIKESLNESVKKLFSNTVTVLKDIKFALFLVIITGMWLMYMQLFFTLPIYITEWFDTRDLYNALGILSSVFGTVEDGEGIIRPEMILNIPAFTIILFQVFMSNRLKKMQPIASMVIGIAVIAVGYSLYIFTTIGAYLVLGVVIIAFGEMASSPRIQEYISRIAPKDKVALYMGYSFLPVAGGNIFGGLLSGSLYASLSDKYAFLRDYVSNNNITVSGNIDTMDGALMLSEAANQLNISTANLTKVLYDTYNPGTIWLVFAVIGIITSLFLFVYNRIINH
jgi:dipeptide/tripeptide permease